MDGGGAPVRGRWELIRRRGSVTYGRVFFSERVRVRFLVAMHGHCAGGESRWSSGRAGRLRGAFRRGQRPRKKTELSIPMHGDDQSSCFQGLAGWHFLLAVPIVSPSLCAKRFSNLASPLQVIVQDSVNGAPSGASAQLR